MIKTTGSLHILCLWSSRQKILHQALGQHPYVNTTCGTDTVQATSSNIGDEDCQSGVEIRETNQSNCVVTM